jgi:GTPase SAR1 family protein
MASENKIVLIGDPEVGKTSIFTRFKNGHFSEDVESQTRKEADCEKKVKVDGKEVVVSVQAKSCRFIKSSNKRAL